MSREFRVLRALYPTVIPVPRTITLCTDSDVLGAPFYVMERVPGAVYRTAEQSERLGSARARALSHALVDVLADLHFLEPGTVGLGDFGRPAGFLERQLRRWSQQLEASRSRPVPGIDELRDRLAAEVPNPAGVAIVHGDYRLDNVLVDADDRITAVLDWEMATIGDPLSDLGLFLVYWDGLPMLPGNPVTNAVSRTAGFPAGAELAARYAARHGVDLAGLRWYVGLGYFKVAVIIEGIHYRYSAGQTVGTGFDRIGELVPPLVALGHEALTGGHG
jgi:aminoglycoside phosphotransferase (APT) family kinase protein